MLILAIWRQTSRASNCVAARTAPMPDLRRGPYRLTDDAGTFCNPHKWARLEGRPGNFVQLGQLVFQVIGGPDWRDFEAWLCHACKGQPLPDEATCRQLGADAIQFHMLVEASDEDDGELPF